MSKVEKRAVVIAWGLLSALGSTGLAQADPFSRAPGDYGTAVNGVLEKTGSDLRFNAKQCGDTPSSDPPSAWCLFSSIHVEVLVIGRDRQPSDVRIARIVLAADILKGHPAVQPHVIVTDAFTALTATMIVFDPDLPADRRSAMVSRLVAEVHRSGHGEDSGCAADYVIDLRQQASTLLVMKVIPKKVE
ncbi:hypothetical protein [Microvirga sp. M2]|uniref:hypothetical protein n=1 Tax=Microvirga sp. M2 TaxID=3073270 RepID=UPI0039C35156